MKRKLRRVGRIFVGAVCLVLAGLGILTWRAVRQEWLNQALIEAAKQADDRAAIRLLEQGADPNCRETTGGRRVISEPLWQALQDMLQPESPIPPMDAMTPLLYAIAGIQAPHAPARAPENTALVRALIKSGADVNVSILEFDPWRGERRITALGAAIGLGRPEAVRALLSHGAKTDLTSANITDDFPPHGPDTVRAFPSAAEAFCAALLLGGVDEGRLADVRTALAHCGKGIDAGYALRTAIALAEYNAAAKPTPQRREILCLLKATGAKQ